MSIVVNLDVMMAKRKVSLNELSERVNITLPRRVLHKLDAAAQAAGESRSGYIAHLALASR